MASTCYDQWRVKQNSKGQRKWVNEGRAPDGACPSCPEPQYPADGTWNGSAACQNGAIVKMVADGNGGRRTGEVIKPAGSPQATAACYESYFIGRGYITDYF